MRWTCSSVTRMKIVWDASETPEYYYNYYNNYYYNHRQTLRPWWHQPTEETDLKHCELISWMMTNCKMSETRKYYYRILLQIPQPPLQKKRDKTRNRNDSKLCELVSGMTMDCKNAINTGILLQNTTTNTTTTTTTREVTDLKLCELVTGMTIVCEAFSTSFL